MLAQMMQYIIERSQDFTTSLSQHLSITFLALGISLVAGLVLGIFASRHARLKSVLLIAGNIGRTIPSLAIIALALPLLGIGRPPTIFALVLIGTLPIMLNTLVGIEQVDESIKESARGMGMTDLQVLVRVELPIAVSIIMAGIRTSAVLLVASATLAAFIGGGGLGDMILRGHALSRDYIILAGAIPATLLAFYFEETFGRLEKWATPIGLKIGQPGFIPNQTSLYELFSAVLVLPLIFGVFSPWVTYTDAEGMDQVLTGLHPQYRLLAGIALVLGMLGALFFKQNDEQESSLNLWIKVSVHLVATVLLGVVIYDLFYHSPASYSLRFGGLLQISGQILLLIGAIFELRSFSQEKLELAKEVVA